MTFILLSIFFVIGIFYLHCTFPDRLQLTDLDLITQTQPQAILSWKKMFHSGATPNRSSVLVSRFDQYLFIRFILDYEYFESFLNLTDKTLEIIFQ